MAIDRTQFNLLVDDSGAGTDGTVWDKNKVQIVVLDPIDVMVTDWANWTPTWTNVTLNNGTVAGRYRKSNKGIEYTASLTFGSSTSVTGAISLNYPVTAVSLSNLTGDVTLVDSSAGPAFYRAMAFLVSGTSQTLRCDNGTAGGALQPVTSTVPFTWTTGDNIFVTGIYEAA